MGAKRFQDLEAWKLGRQLRREVFRLARMPLVRRDFDLRDQLVSAARSVCNNIAEGFGRRSHADFARFLGIAESSLREIENLFTDAIDGEQLTPEDIAKGSELATRTLSAIKSLIAYLVTTPTPHFPRRSRS